MIMSLMHVHARCTFTSGIYALYYNKTSIPLAISSSSSISSSSPGETLKEQQAPRHLPKLHTTSSSSSFSTFPAPTSRLREFKETMSNILHSRPLTTSMSSCTSSSTVLAEITTKDASVADTASFPERQPDWDADSTSSESKSSCSGGGGGEAGAGGGSARYRPAWRPRREVLNIDSIFNRERRRRQAGYSPLGGDYGEVQEERANYSGRHRGGGYEEGGAEPPPAAPPARLIQRMESGYESSERNSSSPVSLELNLGDRSGPAHTSD